MNERASERAIERNRRLTLRTYLAQFFQRLPNHKRALWCVRYTRCNVLLRCTEAHGRENVILFARARAVRRLNFASTTHRSGAFLIFKCPETVDHRHSIRSNHQILLLMECHFPPPQHGHVFYICPAFGQEGGKNRTRTRAARCRGETSHLSDCSNCDRQTVLMTRLRRDRSVTHVNLKVNSQEYSER